VSDDVIILMTDEAHFHLSGCVNKQNSCYWAEENPQKLHQGPLHSAHVTVWCYVANFGVIGPYFFEDKDDGCAVTVLSAYYVEILWIFLAPELSCRGIDFLTIWLQQDGATVRKARASIEVIWEMFPEKLHHCMVSFHGLHVHLICLPVIVCFWGTSKQKCTLLDHRPSMTSR
jgi:hypothetical protein